jgi:hypothetical protein
VRLDGQLVDNLSAARPTARDSDLVVSGPFQPGQRELVTEAKDRVGHVASATLRFVSDSRPPRISWRVDAPSAVNDRGETSFLGPVRLVVEAKDDAEGDGAGVELVEAAAEGSDFARIATRSERLYPGESARIAARDFVGNRAEVQATWKLDREPPKVLIDGSDSPPSTRSSRLSSLILSAGDGLRLEATDDASGVSRFVYRLGESRFERAPKELRFLTPGRFALTLEAVDRFSRVRTVRRDVIVVERAR